jgi:hypothetical protein
MIDSKELIYQAIKVLVEEILSENNQKKFSELKADQDEFLTFKDFCQKYSSIIRPGGLRWIIFNSKQNGSECFIRRVGKRKILISPQKFFDWLELSKRK